MSNDLTIRLAIELDDLHSDQWIEMTSKWTRREIKDLNACSMSELFDEWYAKKVTACHIYDVDGVLIEDPKALTWDGTDNLDQRLFGALSNGLFVGLQKLFLLGQTSVKPSSNGIERLR